MLLFVHYGEVVLLFACLVLYLQSLAGDTHLFIKNNKVQSLSRGEAVYYSFITAATIGYGDITPNHDAENPWPSFVYALVWLKSITILIIVVIELPRLFLHQGVPERCEAPKEPTLIE